jgi:SAM-dependent methyltransferase
MLQQFGDLDAFEFDEQARAYASSLAPRQVAYGCLPDMSGFEEDRFDLIAMLDVLEHIEDDRGSLSTLRSRLAHGGSLLLTVPALPWLWSQHDEIHHHKRRYTKASLTRALTEAGFELSSVGYFNTLLFPLALMQRVALRFTGGHHRADSMPPRLLNNILTRLFSFERRLVGRGRFPLGLSLYAIARPTPN